MTIIEILATIPQYAPDRMHECTELIRHIESGDAALYTPKAIRRIAGYVRNYEHMIPADVRHSIIQSLIDMKTDNEFSKIRSLTMLTQQDASNILSIPKRTIESWDTGDRKCPDYVLSLITYYLRNEGFIQLPITRTDRHTEES